jgi:hypothetical protein
LKTVTVVSKVALIVLCFVVVVGCAADAVQLTPQGSKVEISTRDPNPGLREIGPISATHGFGCGRMGTQGNFEGAYNLLKNRAAELGATHVQIMTQTEPHFEGQCYDNNYTIRGRAFTNK